MAEKTKPGVTKKDGLVTEQGVVIQNITIRPVQRTMLDIEKWRNNHKTAEGINGTRILLYDMYDDVLKDGFLKRLVAKRILAVTKNKVKYIDKSGKEIETADELLKSFSFRKLRKRIQLHKAWGISVIELMNIDGLLKIFDVPKKHILPKEGVITHEQYSYEGIDYRNPPVSNYVFEVGDWDDFGYLLEACAYVIYKRGNIADWANYAQIFGMPFREARYDGYNEQVRIQLEKALDAAGSAAYAVLPKDAEFKIHEQQGTAGSTQLYETLRKAMNEEMLVHILGATETTTSSESSGYAQSKTHQKTTDEVAQDDKEDELSILNELVLPILVNIGLVPNGGKFVYDEPVNLDTAAAKVKIAIDVKTLAKVPVSDDYFYEISGIPKPDNYDELKKQIAEQDAAAAAAALQNSDPQSANTKKQKKQKPEGDPSTGSGQKEGKKLSMLDEFKLWAADFFAQGHES